MKKPRDELVYLGVGSQILRRLAATYLFYSGKLELLRKERLENGMLPWRIIRYQHIVDPETLPIPIARTSYVRPRSFRRQMAYLRKHCTVISLENLAQMIAAREKIPDRTVVVTFDCGWRDIYEIALPVLEHFRIPATVFLPTSFIGGTNLFWSDKILVAMLMLKNKGGKFPPIDLLGKRFFESLRVLSPDGSITLPAIARMLEEMKRLPVEKRLSIFIVVGKLIEELGDFPAYELFLSWPQVREMAQRGVTYGSLGHRHALFGEMAHEELAADIHDSSQMFEQHGVRLLPFVAFPEDAVAKEARAVLRSIGVSLSFSVGEFGLPTDGDNFVPVFGRVEMFENVSFCTELFACRLWGVSAYGFQY